MHKSAANDTPSPRQEETKVCNVLERYVMFWKDTQSNSARFMICIFDIFHLEIPTTSFLAHFRDSYFSAKEQSFTFLPRRRPPAGPALACAEDMT